MKITIKFLGTLGQELFDDHLLTEVVSEFPQGACVKDIFERYNMPVSRGYIAFINHRMAKPNETLEEGMVVSLFQPVYGG